MNKRIAIILLALCSGPVFSYTVTSDDAINPPEFGSREWRQRQKQRELEDRIEAIERDNRWNDR